MRVRERAEEPHRLPAGQQAGDGADCAAAGRVCGCHRRQTWAGAMFLTRQESRDGIEMTFALNHLAYFLLTNLLLELLRAAPAPRVICVASEAHRWSRGIDFDDLQARHRYRGPWAYGQSKLANVLFSNELARRLAGTAVTANAL